MSRPDTVLAFIAAWEARDIDAVLAHMTPDAHYVNVGFSEATGHDQIRAAVTPFLAASTKVTWTVRHIAETAGGAVLTERVDDFEMGGRTLSIPVMGVFEFDGDQICAWRDYFDVPGFQRQAAG